MSDSLLIHVGYHKTATTWLQRKVFANDSSGFDWVLGRNWEARRYLVAPTSLCFDETEARRRFSVALERAHDRGRIPVISDERLSGNPHSGGYDSKENAQRLARTFPEARILIVIRRQRDAIYSTYDQYVEAGGACSIGDYLSHRTRYAVPSFRLEHFEYHRLVSTYLELFGRERVLVLPYEQLKAQPMVFLRRIMDFAGNPSAFVADVAQRANAGRPAILSAVLRRLNPFLVRDDLNGFSILAVPNGRRVVYPLLERGVALLPEAFNSRVERRVRDEIDAACRNYFGQSNRATAELAGLDLRALGYDLD
jgi:hypothetical protein